MKNPRKFFILFLILSLGILAFTPNVLAKDLEVGNTTSCQDCTTEVPITLTGGFNDDNGLAFTLTYDSLKFEFLGLVQTTTAIDDGSTYDPDNPPLPAEVESTIYYQANEKDVDGDIDQILIAAAGVYFFADDTSDVVPFRVQFRVHPETALETYTIGVQQTIIGPDTASSAGYDVDTPIPVATGLDPLDDPSDTETYAVTLTDGSITVSAALKGDVSGDGEITSQDAVDAFYLSFTPWDELTADQQFRADYNGDGQLTAQDAVDIFYARF